MTHNEHLLTILAEECAEVAQRCSKALRFGLTDIQADGQFKDNRERLAQELDDLMAVHRMLVEFELIRKPDLPSQGRKIEKVIYFMDYSNKVGTLT